MTECLVVFEIPEDHRKLASKVDPSGIVSGCGASAAIRRFRSDMYETEIVEPIENQAAPCRARRISTLAGEPRHARVTLGPKIQEIELN